MSGHRPQLRLWHGFGVVVERSDHRCVAEHIGHPSGLPQAWQRVYREHVPAGGHRLRDGIAFEIYSSGDHADPDSMRTELCTPIE